MPSIKPSGGPSTLSEVVSENCFIFPSLRRNSLTEARAAAFVRFLDHTKWHTTVGRTPLDEGSAHGAYTYRITRNNHKRQTSMPPADFKPASHRPSPYTARSLRWATCFSQVCVMPMCKTKVVSSNLSFH
jgi:hypothetical protein